VKRDLIYDVGVHVGEDTEYYLRKGFNVVGIEANPSMYERLIEKFSDAIRSRQLTLLNVGITAEGDAMDFYVCDDVSVWSSFDISLAGRDGARYHAIQVETKDFGTILEQYGVPWYLKVDIEGHDYLCLDALLGIRDRPEFVSIEMNHGSADQDIARLLEAGYSCFKIVSQTTRSQPRPWFVTLNGKLPTLLSKVLRRVEREVRGKRRDGDWTFPNGSSGPISPDTPGPWKDNTAVLKTWRHLQRVENERRPGRGTRDWYDIHAARLT
jgi:FkbM family methyltransferase